MIDAIGAILEFALNMLSGLPDAWTRRIREKRAPGPWG
jgi:hypothetical protein